MGGSQSPCRRPFRPDKVGGLSGPKALLQTAPSLFQSLLHSFGDFPDRPHRIDDPEQIDRFIKLDQWPGLFLVYIEAPGDGFIVVVIAMNQFPAGRDTGIEILLR